MKFKYQVKFLLFFLQKQKLELFFELWFYNSKILKVWFAVWIVEKASRDAQRKPFLSSLVLSESSRFHYHGCQYHTIWYLAIIYIFTPFYVICRPIELKHYCAVKQIISIILDLWNLSRFLLHRPAGLHKIFEKFSLCFQLKFTIYLY